MQTLVQSRKQAMLNYNELLINAYRWTAAPVRSVSSWAMKSSGRLPAMILFYHRVADEHPNPWTISTSRFREQLDWLASEFDLVTLAECQQRIRSGFNDRPTVSITFDDGYAENSQFAIPMLLERQIPFTYFVTLKNVIEQLPFSHDVELGQPLPVDSIETIRALADIGVEIGGHTRTHPDCGKIQCHELLRDEVIDSAKELGEIIGRPVKYFAFPFGQPENLNKSGFRLCRAHDFQGVCSAYGGVNMIGGDAFHLRRIHGDPSMARLKNWLSFDRKHFAAPTFEY